MTSAFRFRIWAVVTMSGCLLGCSAENSNRYTHPTLIAVSKNHPDVGAAFKTCGREAYADGIVIDGTRETDREQVRARYMLDLLKLNPLDGPRRTQQSFLHPPYYAEYVRIEADVSTCVKAKGFEKTLL
jgi:hypothetical protein